MTHHADLTPAATAEAVAGLAPAIRNTRGQFADAVVAPWPHPTPITHFASRDEVGRGGPITHSYDGMSGKYFPVARATFIVPLLIPNNGHPRTPTRHGR